MTWSDALSRRQIPCFLFISLFLAAATECRASDVSVTDRDGVTVVKIDGQQVLEYRSQPNPTKVYVSKWFTPQGVQLLRDSPHDHVHHHALMYAVGIDGVDFWSEVPPTDYGRQVSRGVSTQGVTNDQGTTASIQQQIDWIAPDQQMLASETRKLTVHAGAIQDASLLTWQFSLTPGEGRDSIELWGRHYFGLGLRFLESMDKGGTFLFPEQVEFEPVRGSEKLTRANWCAYHAVADGKPVTVAVFDAPSNPRHPATWFTMDAPFAYLAATWKLHEEPMTVEANKLLKVRYGLAAWDGAVSKAEIEASYQAWLRFDSQ